MTTDATSTVQLGLCEPPRPAGRPARPTDGDPDVILAGAKLAVGRFMKYLAQGDCTNDAEEILADLVKLVQSRSHSGYHLARQLERDGWVEDEELVGLCDHLLNSIHSAQRSKLAEWIAAFPMVPKLALEQSVTCTIRGTKHNGIVTGIDERNAVYTVMIPALGHVRKGLGVHGFCIAFEVLEAAQ